MGVVLYQLYTNQYPYNGSSALQLYQFHHSLTLPFYPLSSFSRRQHQPLNFPSYIPPLAQDFLRKVFAIDPASRPTAAACLKHPFIAEFSTNGGTPVSYNTRNVKLAPSLTIHVETIERLIGKTCFSFSSLHFLCLLYLFLLLPSLIQCLSNEHLRLPYPPHLLHPQFLSLNSTPHPPVQHNLLLP